MGQYALILIAGFMLVFGWAQTSLNRNDEQAVENMVFYYEHSSAQNLANSSARIALTRLTQDASGFNGWIDLPMFDGQSTVILADNTSDTTLVRGFIRVTATATVGDMTHTSVVLWKRTPFSHYAYFTNVEPLIYFITPDTLKGPVHTNGTMHISGSPVFQGIVTSPNPWVGVGAPEFQQGADFNHPVVTLPINLDPLIDAAQDGGAAVILATGKTLWLDFLSNGTVNYVVLNTGTSPGGSTTWTNFDLSTINGVIGCNRDIHIKGTIHGQFTVASKTNVYIEGDILYANDPRLGPSNDLLGIVSKQQIIVVQNAANATNCEIHASLMALDKFTVENYGGGTPRGTLSILGGVIQETRGAVGTFSGQTLVTGYKKNYQYDDRLMTMLPPFYPLTGDHVGGTAYAPGRVVSWYE